jgi:hypothetical protein
VTLREHLESLHVSDDRRYAEVAVEREKALKIKEVADLAALELARQIQTYKDEKANELRSQIERERGSYATQQDLKGATDKLEAIIAPLLANLAASRGKSNLWQILVAAVVAVVATVSAVKGWK